MNPITSNSLIRIKEGNNYNSQATQKSRPTLMVLVRRRASRGYFVVIIPFTFILLIKSRFTVFTRD